MRSRSQRIRSQRRQKPGAGKRERERTARAIKTISLENNIARCFFFFPQLKTSSFLRLFLIQVTEGTDDDAPTLPTERLAELPANAPEGTACFAVALPSPLSSKPKAATTLDVLTVFTKAQRPHPAKISTGQQQRVVLLYSVTIASPYAVEKQQTVVRMPGKVESYAHAEQPPRPDVVGGASATLLSHGPLEGPRAPFSLLPGRVHFVNNAPFAHAERLEREIEVSHWGNVAVRERLRPLANLGAEHCGEWSRLDFSANAEATNPTALQALGLILPPEARWFHFRDEIGNISSSNVMGGPERSGRAGKNGKPNKNNSKKAKRGAKRTAPVEGVIYPRYPLAGGWRAAFEFGWSIPLAAVAAELTGEDKRASLERGAVGGAAAASASAVALSSRRVRLTLPSFFTPIRDVVADDLSVVLVLPEGASRISHSLSFEVDSAVLGRRQTYLDTTGRATLTLGLRNAVEDHGAPLVVEYSLPRWRTAAEPLMVVAAVASVIAAVFFSSKVDLSLDGGGDDGEEGEGEGKEKRSSKAKTALAKAS